MGFFDMKEIGSMISVGGGNLQQIFLGSLSTVVG